MPSYFPCSPVIRESSWKEIQIEKKSFASKLLINSVVATLRKVLGFAVKTMWQKRMKTCIWQINGWLILVNKFKQI